MPIKNIRKILVIGSGPVVIGQGSEFDYSGTQAILALMEEGIEVVLVNSNPATIMTEPSLATKTYIEPLNISVIERIIAKELPDAILPTMGGQTALNLTLSLDKKGILVKYNVRLLSVNSETIAVTEDRKLFCGKVKELGFNVADSTTVQTVDEALVYTQNKQYPIIIRPSFTLGGTGGGKAYSETELIQMVTQGLKLSPVSEVLVEESLVGWKEIELELIKDCQGQTIVVCGIENFDPMGVHTGDSIAVSPIQTLTDVEYQEIRRQAHALMNAVELEAGGANVQFAIHPKNGQIIIVEMNPRVSRSSALASKATGYPIAKISAKLALGYTLDELMNRVTGNTIPAMFEPSIDYVVVKIPKFDLNKFDGVDEELSTQMKAIGEVMAVGHSFIEALLKAIHSIDAVIFLDKKNDRKKITQLLEQPSPSRLSAIFSAFKTGFTLDEIHSLTQIDKWFLYSLQQWVVLFEKASQTSNLTKDFCRQLKKNGFTDALIADLFNNDTSNIKNMRLQWNIHPGFFKIDSCAAEFPTETSYYYSSYSNDSRVMPRNIKKVLILGSGPNRIGQGLEFDYSCVIAAKEYRRLGFETIMLNSNPETVSTDFEIADKLYFEPVTLESVMEVVHAEIPDYVILQFGGQTPLSLSQKLSELGVQILGTSIESIFIAEDRAMFAECANELGICYPQSFDSMNKDEAYSFVSKIGFPVIMRPSFVIGGENIVISRSEEELIQLLEKLFQQGPQRIQIEQFLEGAKEFDIDGIADGNTCYIVGIMEHIETVGVHSGDSSSIYPPQNLSQKHEREITHITQKLVQRLDLIGAFNIQFAIKEDKVYVLELNPRASRSVPYISKTRRYPFIEHAVQVSLGKKIKDLDYFSGYKKRMALKLPVFPFGKLKGAHFALGPNMKSTGESLSLGSSRSEILSKMILNFSPDLLGKKAKIYFNCYKAVLHDKYNDELTRLGFDILLPKELINIQSNYTNTVLDLISKRDIDLIISIFNESQETQEEQIVKQFAAQHGLPIILSEEWLVIWIEGVSAHENTDYNIYSMQT